MHAGQNVHQGSLTGSGVPDQSVDLLRMSPPRDEQSRGFQKDKNAYRNLVDNKNSLVHHRRVAHDLSEDCRGGPKIKVAGVFRVLDLVTG